MHRYSFFDHFTNLFLLISSKRLDYVNHARRLAEDDWVDTGQQVKASAEEGDEDMEVELGKKLPKRYANQVNGGWCQGVLYQFGAELWLASKRTEDSFTMKCLKCKLEPSL